MLVITILFEDGLVWVAESVNTAVVSHGRFTINMYLDMKTKNENKYIYLKTRKKSFPLTQKS